MSYKNCLKIEETEKLDMEQMNDSISHKTEINKEYMIYLLDNFKEGIIERKNQAR